MALELGLWRVDQEPVRLQAVPMALESRLETMIESDPSLLGVDVLLIGRQVPTAYGKYIDLLAIDSEGVLHVLELKRDKTPRDVVAQLLDYGSWVQTLGQQDVRDLFADKNPGTAFDTAFAEKFGEAPPDLVNASHVLTVVASALDTSTERIVAYLNTVHGVPINAVFFRFFEDDGRSYLARTWLIDDAIQQATPKPRSTSGGTLAEWDGRTWYATFGQAPGGRSWEDGRRYGFISAGGGKYYSQLLRNIPVGARVFVFVPGQPRGYVAVGTAIAEAVPADDAVLTVDGVPTRFLDLDLQGDYTHPPAEDPADETREFVVAMEWEVARPLAEGVWKTGFFAVPLTACRLRNQFTIDEVSAAFGVDD
ncbi:DUF91 domain-containing protein [Leifsonia shinshuensis]|uniref:endonuclease NucS domain-containing protein n=1 Tax=Leifsonia shinshuensis TaxID=150026 RepID=UPI001F50871B|nr:endonuclease NucS domain-containing protein [Leifsonia shinshuensis]MCI0158402.1 DUF91 domain-containing protein [Leifsonia shinshuensis]